MAYSSKRKGKTYFGALRLVQGSGDGGSKNGPLKKHEDHVMENAGVSFWDVI
jgi:hypothetical protein